MKRKITNYHFLVLMTGVVFLLMGVGMFLFIEKPLPVAVKIKTSSHPSLGNPDARVHLVLFEDFQCPACRRFSREVFPKLKEKYIDTNQVRLSVVVLAFFESSRPSSKLALSLYHKDPESFFSFLQYIVGEEVLMRSSHELRAFLNNPSLFDESQSSPRVEEVLDHNYYQAKALMGRNFEIPALYINGRYHAKMDFESLSKHIDYELKEIGEAASD